MNDITRIISDLEQQRSAIDRAISALREVSGRGGTSSATSVRAAGAPATKKKRVLSPEGRQRIVDATKRRWAAKRAADKRQAAGNSSKKKAATKE